MERGDDRHGGGLIAVNIKADLRPLHRAFLDIGHKQVPFATALALTRIAKAVQADEIGEIDRTFEKATKFTENAFAVQPAKKTAPIAVVFAKDIQEQYLEPYVVGGNRSLGTKKGMLVPIGAATNAFGNLSRGQLARLKAKPNVFVGSITFRKTGRTVSGVWQRGSTPRGARRKGNGEYGTKGNSQNQVGGVRSTLKLLIEFADTTPVKKRLDFEGRARATIRRVARREFEAALSQALATARR